MGVLAAAVLGVGLLRADGGSAAQSTYLMDLHLHGSLSEGFGTMSNHIQQAVVAGYDGLWWSEHMTRQDNGMFPITIPFEGSLESALLPPPLSVPMMRMEVDGPDPALLDLAYRSSSPAEGQQHLRVTADAANVSGGGTKFAFLTLNGYDRGHRQSLLSEPVVSTWIRLRNLQGDAGMAFRFRLSGLPDGSTREGTPRFLEFVPGNFNPPPAAPQTTRIATAPLPVDQWIYARVRLAELIGVVAVLEPDMSLIDAELVFYAGNGGKLTVDLDALTIDREGPAGVDSYAAQAQLLPQLTGSGLFHRVGAEVEGPLDQQIQSVSSRDHLIALFPAVTPVALSFPPGSAAALSYPTSGVQGIQAAGGVAVLAHLFGSEQDHNNTGIVIPSSTADVLADRVVDNEAWGADAMEVGYPRRGRWLEEFVEVWDRLAADRVYVTGVGSSDNHDLEPWVQRRNRWGSWVVADSSSASDLVKAIRRGRVFFGDPFQFDPDGTFEFREDSYDYWMGDVVPIQSGQEKFRIDLDGAASGDDEVVLLKNGVEVYRRGVDSSGRADFYKRINVSPGDWVRAELRDPQDKAYVYTNPIYFIGQSSQPPSWRDPQN